MLAGALLGGCDVAVTATAPVSSDSMTDSTTGEDSGDARSSSGDASTEIAAEESTGAESSTTDTDASSGESTGSASTGPTLLPDGAPCDDGAACESAVCSPLGTCAPACPCDDTAACVALACIEVGGDGEGATGPINDSPAGTVDATDVDVFGVVLPGPGLYRVIVHGAGVTAWIVDGAGMTVAAPADATDLDDEGENTARDFEVSDVSEPVTVIIVGPGLDTPTAYYFYTTQL